MIDAFIHCFLHFAALQPLDTSGSGLSYCVIERPSNFRMCIPKTDKHFVLTCNMTGCTLHMQNEVYLSEDSHCSYKIIATRATMRHLTRRVEGVGHKLFVDSFFSSHTVCDYLASR